MKKVKKANKNPKTFAFDPFLYDKVAAYYYKNNPIINDMGNLTFEDLYDLYKEMNAANK